MSARTVTVHDKSFPPSLHGRDATDLDVPLGELSTPLLVLDGPAMAHNLQVMADWSAARGLELMPHGKTTMAPVLWRRQLEAGAVGITVATGWQAEVALRAGVPTVQIANMCLDPALLRTLAAHLAEHPAQELVCWADSLAAVRLMEAALPAGARIGVLVELGAAAGRTGVRDEQLALEIARAIADSDRLVLRGVSGYEGALGHDRSEAALEAVRTYCARLAALGREVAPLVDGPAWVTAGGSAYPDLVAAAIAGIEGTRAILRSGAYIVHDSVFYRGISPLDRDRGLAEREALLPAMRAHARVLSQPEPGLALLDAGKRDVPYDEGLPVPLAVAAELGGQERPFPAEARAEITALNDQHAFLHWEGEAPVAIGDVVTLGLSHPCTAFDKWRLIPVVDADGIVREAVETLF
ncbi:alanine racemase [Brachybacterium saurashtrense]|uniref:Amino acid deaminase n=1 Tax=Brachybacterium saurashtrense TaxID=556288 RepID=A0A345YJU4_9MICO|nr:alanine racemase [Brachybacterium saurashtrense]AXK44196.1 amino acid deaminase [Brachybacterium saurashtrense]RRR21468.1 amino acid deaminase [Brachybacterium saurashtrense]